MNTVIYVRADDYNKAESQQKYICQYASEHNLYIAEIFKDYENPKTLNQKRCFLKYFQKYCYEHKDKIDIVLMSDIASLGKDEWESIEFAKFFHDNRVNVHFINQDFTLFDNDGAESDILSLLLDVRNTGVKERLYAGFCKYRENGGKVGRKKLTKVQIKRKYPKLLKLLNKGVGVVEVAKQCDISESTVIRLKKVMGF